MFQKCIMTGVMYMIGGRRTACPVRFQSMDRDRTEIERNGGPLNGAGLNRGFWTVVQTVRLWAISNFLTITISLPYRSLSTFGG